MEYEEIANASAAVALDEHYFVVGDDEERFLSVYRFGRPTPTAQPNLEKILDKKLDLEADIEASARIDDTIFWIGSHGTDSAGNSAPDRQMLFATKIVHEGDGFDFVLIDKVYRKLLDDMQANSTLRKVFRFPDIRRIPPKERGGMSIEGLAATPDDGLLIGFRNPLIRGLAILVEITNPRKIIRGEAPKFRQPVFLDLDGRGIRSIDLVKRDGRQPGYLIVGGPFGIEDKPRPALFYWNGKVRDKPQKLHAPLPDDFNPEALLVTRDNKQVWVLSDDGKLFRGREKLLGTKRFRAVPFDLDQILDGV